MKTKISENDLRNLIRNEVRKIVGEDSLIEPPDLGDPHYLNIDGPAVPMAMDDDEYEDDDMDYGRYSHSHTQMEPAAGSCASGMHTLSEGCGCGEKNGLEKDDEMLSAILKNPMPCTNCGKIHPEGACSGESHHKGSYMAKPQLAKISNYAEKLLSMIGEGEQIQDWQESKISQMSQMISDVYHSIEYKKHKGEI